MLMALKGSKHERKNYWKNSQFSVSLKHALDGVIIIFQEEHNMRRHALFGLLPLLGGWYFQINVMEWISIITCIFLVIIMEFLNTIFETVVDMVTNFEFHPLAKKAKDIAAGAVLITAFFTVIVAAIIFIPKIWTRFF